MQQEPSANAPALARAWRAIVRAFTPAPEARGPLNDGADTTLFGGPTQQPRSRRGADGTKDEFWVPTGESTDFAELDPDLDSKRRR